MKVIFFLPGSTHLVVTSEPHKAAPKGKSNDVELVRADCRMEKDLSGYNFNELPSNAALRSAFGGTSTRRDGWIASFNKATIAVKQRLHLEDFAASIGATDFTVA